MLAEDRELRVELLAEAFGGTRTFRSTRFKRSFAVNPTTEPLAHYLEVHGGVSNPCFGKLRITRLEEGQEVDEHFPTAFMEVNGVTNIIDLRASQAHVPSSVRRLGYKAAELLDGSYECISADALGQPRERKAAAFLSVAAAVVRPNKMDVALAYDALRKQPSMSLGDLAATFGSPNGLSIACALVVNGLASVQRMNAEPSKIIVRAAFETERCDELGCPVLLISPVGRGAKGEQVSQLALPAAG